MPYSIKSINLVFSQNTTYIFVNNSSFTYTYPETPKPYGAIAAMLWEPFDKFRIHYILTVPSSPPVYNTNYNPLITTYSKIGRIYLAFKDVIIYKEDLIYKKKALNNYQFFNLCPDVNTPAEYYQSPNTVSRMIVEFFKPGISLQVNFSKPFYYENAPTTP